MVAPVAMDDAEDEPSDELPEWLQAFDPDDYLEEESVHDFVEGLADAEEFHAPAGPDARAATDASDAYRGRASSPRHRTPAIQRMVRALREWQRG